MKKLMVMGTASHVGKSVIVAALCRIFSDAGCNVAPFKAQNMSLNSWVTEDGKEMGIAQAVQARAARIEPAVEMNPVLLKPKSDGVSQVVVMGKPFADRGAGNYYDSIDGIMGIVRSAFEKLAAGRDIVIIEGAGGAAEINLYDKDIVNIGTARMLKPPIILVGDIERGGVFASIYGTLELLPVDIKPLVKGIIINKFRGDLALLEPGLRELEKLAGIPVLGVIPYIKLKIPSEDSLSLRDKSPGDSPVEIAVMRLPHISNFTDFEPLEPFAKVRYVELSEEPGSPDAVIIPGTKNTIDDMRALERSGKAGWLREIAGKIPIVGICGGYQMLGKFIHDSGIEGSEGECTVRGLGLLDATTHFGEYEKSTRRVRKAVNRHGPFGDAGDTVEGYEIHMGETVSASLPLFSGEGSAGELVFGSYLHGLFENEKVRDSFLSYLYKRRGRRYEPQKTGDAFDELAAAVMSNIDMAKLNNIAGL